MFNRLHDAVANSTQAYEVRLTQQIEELERQLVELREQQAHNKERQQRQLTLVGALQSALGQVIKATALTENAGEEDLLEAFWEEIEAVKSGEYESVDIKELPDAESEPSTNPSQPTPNGGNGGAIIDDNLITSVVDIVKADLPELKDWVRRYKTDDECRQYGSLRSRKVWEDIAKDILNQISATKKLLTQGTSFSNGNGNGNGNGNYSNGNGGETEPDVQHNNSDDVVDVDVS